MNHRVAYQGKAETKGLFAHDHLTSSHSCSGGCSLDESPPPPPPVAARELSAATASACSDSTSSPTTAVPVVVVAPPPPPPAVGTAGRRPAPRGAMETCAAAPAAAAAATQSASASLNSCSLSAEVVWPNRCGNTLACGGGGCCTPVAAGARVVAPPECAWPRLRLHRALPAHTRRRRAHNHEVKARSDNGIRVHDSK